MPKYSKEELRHIAIALGEAGYKGLANTIYWWNSSPSKGLAKHYLDYKVMTRPKRDMPLFLHDHDEAIRVIAAARLSYKP